MCVCVLSAHLVVVVWVWLHISYVVRPGSSGHSNWMRGLRSQYYVCPIVPYSQEQNAFGSSLKKSLDEHRMYTHCQVDLQQCAQIQVTKRSGQ